VDGAGSWKPAVTPRADERPARAAPDGPVHGARALLAARPVPAAWQWAPALAVYLTVFVTVFALPVVSHLDVPQLRQYWTDPNFYTWAMRWWPYAVTHGLNPLYSSQIGAPGGENLAWVTTTPSVSLLFWPVTDALGVIVSYNLMLLLVPPLSALAAFIAARRLTGRFWAALLAGAVYGFTPFELVHDWQGQPNLTMIALLPLLVYLVQVWWDGTLGRTGFVVWTAVLMAAEFYTFNEAFADMAMVAVGTLAIAFAVAGRPARRKVARLAGLTAAGFAGAILLAAPYLFYALRQYPAALSRQQASFSLHLVRLVLPSSDKLFGLSGLISYSHRVGRAGLDDYVGIPLLLIPFVLVACARSDKLARLLAAAFVFVLALGAGPALVIGNGQTFRLPWGGLWGLPGLRAAEPSRLIIFGFLALSMALARWLARPAAGWLPSAGRWALALLAAAVLFADLPTAYSAMSPVASGAPVPVTVAPASQLPNQLPPFITAGLYRRYLRPGETVVVVTYRGNAGLLFQADADFYFRIAGGFINDSLTPRQDALPADVGNLNDPFGPRIRDFESYLRTSGIGAILVEQAWAEPWMGVFGRLGLHGTSAGGVTVYPVPAGYRGPAKPPPGGFRVRHAPT
jgi:hypothetical protein